MDIRKQKKTLLQDKMTKDKVKALCVIRLWILTPPDISTQDENWLQTMSSDQVSDHSADQSTQQSFGFHHDS